jgi:hypothetical protein
MDAVKNGIGPSRVLTSVFSDTLDKAASSAVISQRLGIIKEDVRLVILFHNLSGIRIVFGIVDSTHDQTQSRMLSRSRTDL